jgi:drug/metabolite transporter (DMT)-like permease
VQIESSGGRAPSRGLIVASIALLIVVWAVNFVAGKIGLRSFPVLALASFRVVLAGVVMIPAYLVCSRLPAFAEAAYARRKGFTRHDFWTFLYLGFFGVTVNQLCFTISLRYTSVSHASVIVGIGPIYTLVLAVLFQLETVTLRKAFGMAIALAGIVVMASEKGLSPHWPSLFGDAIVMTGSIGFAMYVVLGKRVSGKYDTLTMTAFNHFAGAVIVLPLAVHEARMLSLAEKWRALPWTGWAALLYMAVFSSAMAYVFYFWLLRYLEASQLGAFSYLVPMLATILGILWLGEKGSWSQLLGSILALGGLYWIESSRATSERKSPDS